MLLFGLNMTNIASLPREVLLQLFSLLGYRDLISVRRMCKLWHSLSQDDGLLRRIAGRDFNEEAWDQESYPSREDVRLAVFLGIDIVIQTIFINFS